MINVEKINNAKPVDFFNDLTEEEKAEAELMASIAIAIHNKRVSMNMNQQEFAELNGVSQAMVSKWESGEYNFTISTLRKILAALGITIALQEVEPKKEENKQRGRFRWETASSGGGAAFFARSVAASQSSI